MEQERYKRQKDAETSLKDAYTAAAGVVSALAVVGGTGGGGGAAR